MLRQSFAKLRAINSGMTFHPARTQSKAPTPLIITIEQTAALRREATERENKGGNARVWECCCEEAARTQDTSHVKCFRRLRRWSV